MEYLSSRAGSLCHREQAPASFRRLSIFRVLDQAHRMQHSPKESKLPKGMRNLHWPVSVDGSVLHLVPNVDQEDLNLIFRPAQALGKCRHCPPLDALEIVLKRPGSQGLVVLIFRP